mmetsp:Transcript_13125/g.40405  ORF Transcript_13125/g.40405 Transcript_13125/m.40405 type:complete len:551 (+) Transcript_13125:581-2233(+)
MVKVGAWLKKRISFHVNVAVVDGRRAKRVGDQFRQQDCDHERQEQVQLVGQLQHDDSQRHRHLRHPSKDGSGSHNGVHRASGTVRAARTLPKYEEVGQSQRKDVDADPDDCAKDGSDCQRGDEEACRNSGAKRERRQNELLHSSVGQSDDELPAPRRITQQRKPLAAAHNFVGHAAPKQRGKDQAVGLSKEGEDPVCADCEGHEDESLQDGTAFPEGAPQLRLHPPQVELYPEVADEPSGDADKGDGNELEPVPVYNALNLKHDEPSVEKGVVHLQNEGRGSSAVESAPEHVVWEEGGGLLQREEDAPDRRPKGSCDPGSACTGQNISDRGLVITEQPKPGRQEKPDTGGQVDDRTLLAEVQPGRDGQGQPGNLDDEGPGAQVALHDGAVQHGLDLGDARPRCVWGKSLHQPRGGDAVEAREGDVRDEVGDVIAQKVSPGDEVVTFLRASADTAHLLCEVESPRADAPPQRRQKLDGGVEHAADDAGDDASRREHDVHHDEKLAHARLVFHLSLQETGVLVHPVDDLEIAGEICAFLVRFGVQPLSKVAV